MPTGDLYIDRRKHRRVQTKLHVTYKVMSGEEFDIKLSEPEKKHSVETDDISTSGLQLLCDEELKKDSIVRLDVEVNHAGENIATFAEVRWIRRDQAINKFRIGLEFLVVKEDHIVIIKKLIGE
jgi:c-di-GMP-binding flagellar brake protein YcgR